MPRLAQDFTTDLDALAAGLHSDYAGEPYAFSRYADGEAAIAFGEPHRAQRDGWEVGAAAPLWLRASLLDSLRCDLDGWHVGITAAEHHPRCHVQLLRECRVPPDRISYAEIFILANYRRFLGLDLTGCQTVGFRGTDFEVPGTPTDPAWRRVDGFAAELVEFAHSPILVSAGPAGKILIHRYWAMTEAQPYRRRVIVDVGSALDVRLKGRRTRRYQVPDSAKQEWIPRWTRQSTGERRG